MINLQKIQRKLLLFILLFVIVFAGCDDPGSVVLDQFLSEAPVHVSSYTGELHRVGTVKQFGSRIESPDALEWSGESLYMLADRGSYRDESQYLFRVDRETGEAEMVNPQARDLGGSFTQGRGFTQVLYVSPSDMTWHPDGQMLAVCPVIDSIVTIDLETGLAGRITFSKDYCLRFPEDHSVFAGQPVIGGGRALAWTDNGLYMWGMSLHNKNLIDSGHRSFGGLYKISETLKCATPVGSPVYFGQPREGPAYPDEGEAYAYSFCFDGQHLYMSGADTRSLYILDQLIGELYFVAKWVYAELPLGHAIHEKETGQDSVLTKMPQNHDGTLYCYRNIQENTCFDFPDITGLAFDGVNMYAVCGFTDALYIIE